MTAEQLGLAAMPTPLRPVTPARVESYDDCPRRFRHTYVDRPPPPRGAPWAHTGIGAAVHTALKALYDLRPRERGVGAALAALRANWPEVGFRDTEQRRSAYDVVRGWLAAYVPTMPLAEDPRGVERTVAAPVGTLAVSGRVDRIDQTDGPDGPGLVVVDYKTGRWQPTADDARGSMQLALYAVAAARTLRTPTRRVELHHLPSGTVASWEHTPESLQRQLRRASDTADDIQRSAARVAEGDDPDAAYPARPGPACGWCDFRGACAPGRAAAPAREPWFAVPTAEDPDRRAARAVS